ncbi:MAG: hypothetical protein COX52_09820, partial [Syntrophobacterales bacterium CG23_combo_of_CG06-09_8_20_14_all_48_27]
FLAMPYSFSDKVEKLISILRVLVPWWLPEQLQKYLLLVLTFGISGGRVRMQQDQFTQYDDYY